MLLVALIEVILGNILLSGYASWTIYAALICASLTHSLLSCVNAVFKLTFPPIHLLIWLIFYRLLLPFCKFASMPIIYTLSQCV